MASYLQPAFKVQKTVEIYREKRWSPCGRMNREGELGGSKASWEFWDCLSAPGASLPQLHHGFSFLTRAFFSSFSTCHPYVISVSKVFMTNHVTISHFSLELWFLFWISSYSPLSSSLSHMHLQVTISQQDPCFPCSLGLFTWVHKASNWLKPEKKIPGVIFGLFSFPCCPLHTTVFLVVRFGFQTMSSFVTSPSSQPCLSRSLGKSKTLTKICQQVTMLVLFSHGSINNLVFIILKVMTGCVLIIY